MGAYLSAGAAACISWMLLVACGGKSTTDSGSTGSAGTASAVTGSGSAASTATVGAGGSTDTGGASGTGGFGGTGGSGGSSLDQLDSQCVSLASMIDGSSQNPGCIACIEGSQKGACVGEVGLTLDTTQGPCATANGCVRGACKCENGMCAPGFCGCVHGCVARAPVDCVSAWLDAFRCLSSVCAGSCN